MHCVDTIVNKIFDGIQQRISNAFHRTDTAVKMPSTDDLINTVTKSNHLWDDYCNELRKNGIITNVGCKEYLFVFIESNKKHIAEQHFILESSHNEDLKSSSSGRKDNNARSSFTTFVKYVLLVQSESNLLRKMFQNCEDEVIYSATRSNANLKESASETKLHQAIHKIKNKETTGSKTYQEDSMKTS